MKPKHVLLALFAVAVAAMYFLSPRGDTSAAQAQSVVEAGGVLVDVRTPAEFSAGHIEGARNIPIDELGARVAELGPAATTPVVVYCQTGARSTNAARVLRDAGFAAVYNLGPMRAWSSP